MLGVLYLPNYLQLLTIFGFLTSPLKNLELRPLEIAACDTCQPPGMACYKRATRHSGKMSFFLLKRRLHLNMSFRTADPFDAWYFVFCTFYWFATSYHLWIPHLSTEESWAHSLWNSCLWYVSASWHGLLQMYNKALRLNELVFTDQETSVIFLVFKTVDPFDVWYFVLVPSSWFATCHHLWMQHLCTEESLAQAL